MNEPQPWPRPLKVITTAELARLAQHPPRRHRKLWLTAGLIALTFLLIAPWALAQSAEGWTAPVEVKKGKQKAATYRARLAGDVLVIEVAHEPGWHTYALDNEARAKKQAGKPPLGIEKDTEIAVSGGLQVIGKWRQSSPKDLTQPELSWYTWGFEGVSYFAARVKRIGTAEALVTINAQACKATMCAMVDDLELRLQTPPASQAMFDLTTLIEAGDLSALMK